VSATHSIREFVRERSGTSQHRSGGRAVLEVMRKKRAAPNTTVSTDPPAGTGAGGCRTTPGIGERRAVVRRIGKYADLAPYFGIPIKINKVSLTPQCRRREWKIVELYRVGR
jgi:hypothetical protein